MESIWENIPTAALCDLQNLLIESNTSAPGDRLDDYNSQGFGNFVSLSRTGSFSQSLFPSPTTSREGSLSGPLLFQQTSSSVQGNDHFLNHTSSTKKRKTISGATHINDSLSSSVTEASSTVTDAALELDDRRLPFEERARLDTDNHPSVVHQNIEPLSSVEKAYIEKASYLVSNIQGLSEKQDMQIEDIPSGYNAAMMKKNVEELALLESDVVSILNQVNTETERLKDVMQMFAMDANSLYTVQLLSSHLAVQRHYLELYLETIVKSPHKLNSEPPIRVVILEQPNAHVMFKEKVMDTYFKIIVLRGLQHDNGDRESGLGDQSLDGLEVKALLMTEDLSLFKHANPLENNTTITMSDDLDTVVHASFHHIKVNASSRMSPVRLKFALKKSNIFGGLPCEKEELKQGSDIKKRGKNKRNISIKGKGKITKVSNGREVAAATRVRSKGKRKTYREDFDDDIFPSGVLSEESNPFIVITNESQWMEAASKLVMISAFETSSTTTTTWAHFANILHLHFVSATRQELNDPPRALQYYELRYFQSKVNLVNEGGEIISKRGDAYGESKKDETLIKEENALFPLPFISKKEAIHFFQWFGAVERSIRFKKHVFSLWIEGLLFGFRCKNSALKALENQGIGTFLIRFSDSQAGLFALAYVTSDPHERIRHYLVREHDIGSNKGLPDFLREAEILQYILQVEPQSGKLTRIKKDVALKQYYSKRKMLRATGYSPQLV